MFNNLTINDYFIYDTEYYLVLANNYLKLMCLILWH